MTKIMQALQLWDHPPPRTPDGYVLSFKRRIAAGVIWGFAKEIDNAKEATKTM